MAAARRPEDVRGRHRRPWRTAGSRSPLLAARRDGPPAARAPRALLLRPAARPLGHRRRLDTAGRARPREVPVCAADRARLADGDDPAVREVDTDHGRRPVLGGGPGVRPLGRRLLRRRPAARPAGRHHARQHDGRPRLRGRLRRRVRRLRAATRAATSPARTSTPGTSGADSATSAAASAAAATSAAASRRGSGAASSSGAVRGRPVLALPRPGPRAVTSARPRSLEPGEPERPPSR